MTISCFEHEDQYLRIDGKLTKKESDSCRVDLRNIKLDYVLDIVQFDDVEFGGLVTGKVHLKSHEEPSDADPSECAQILSEPFFIRRSRHCRCMG